MNLGRTGLTTEHVLNRLGATTCGGCHQFSNNQPIAPPETPGGDSVRWKPSLGFVHVNENGDLSAALREAFLPARREHMLSRLCAPKPWTLDVDHDRKYELNTDGILLFRHFIGATSVGLTHNAIGSGAVRTSTRAIIDYIDEGCTGPLDIDGDGSCTLTEDVLPALWHLFRGVVPDNVVQSIVGPGSTRTTPEAINAYVRTLTPDIAWTLDVDGDGSYDLFVDGLLLYRVIFLNQEDEQLTQNVTFRAGSIRTEPSAIAAYVREGVDSGILDIDGDGVTSGQTDLLAVLWYLFRRQIPSHVLNGLISSGSTRSTLPELIVYMETLKP